MAHFMATVGAPWIEAHPLVVMGTLIAMLVGSWWAARRMP